MGKPGKTESVRSSSNKVAWVYFDERSAIERATLIIDKKSGQLVAKTWQVEDGDLEQRVDAALKRYPNAHFKRRELKWINPHIAPDEAYYEDQDLGLSIEVRKKRNEVFSITWTLPGTVAFGNKTKADCVKFQKKNGLVSCKGLGTSGIDPGDEKPAARD